MGRVGEHDVVFGRRTGHEQVTFCHDRSPGCGRSSPSTRRRSGRRSAAPASTPTRARPPRSPTCSTCRRAMAYKNALAGLAHGGGKAVIIGDPATDKSPALLRAYGRFVQGLGGRYITACDVGTYVAGHGRRRREVRLRHRAQRGTRRRRATPACSRRSACTRACSPRHEHRWGADSLDGRRIGVAGVGKVGTPPHRARPRRRRRRSS